MICVLLDVERLGPINTSNPFMLGARKSLTFCEFTVYDKRNWSPLTTTSGAEQVKVILSSAHAPITVVIIINKRITFLILSVLLSFQSAKLSIYQSLSNFFPWICICFFTLSCTFFSSCITAFNNCWAFSFDISFLFCCCCCWFCWSFLSCSC